jgi:hypothetical protein
MSKTIPLTQGKVAIVDDEDYNKLIQFKWSARRDSKSGTWYALHTYREGNGWKTILMHRKIVNASDGMDVDHENHNGLDNRKFNLRVCKHRYNCRNRRIQSNNTSDVAGVSWHKRDKKWMVYVRIDGKLKHFGYYSNLDEAIHVRHDAEKKYFGEFRYDSKKDVV